MTRFSLLLISLLSMLNLVRAAPGNADATFNPYTVANFAVVYAIAVQPDGKILIGGNFEAVNTTTIHGIARLNVDGTVDTTFLPNGISSVGTDTVKSIVVQSDGKILIGGPFSSVLGEPRNKIARLNSNGTLDFTFDPGIGPDFDLNAIALQRDGKILVGGTFEKFNNVTHGGMVRLNSDGSLDSTFSPPTSTLYNITNILVQPDGKILIGGLIGVIVSGTYCNGPLRLNANGTLDSTFNTGTGAGVNNMALQADGKIVVVGNFSSINNVPRPKIARLNTNGSVETTATFNPGTGVGGFLSKANAVQVQTDGKIVIVGEFSDFNGQTRGSIARLSSSGALDTTATFDTGTGFSGTPVWTLAIQADGKILAGGFLSGYNGATHRTIVRILNEPASQSLDVSDGNSIIWLRGGASQEALDVNFERSVDDGVTWTQLGYGTRIAGGWQITGINQPSSGKIRARARLGTGGSSASGLVEQIASFNFPPPTASTLPATTLTGVGGILNASVNANGRSTMVTFDYGLSDSYGSTIAASPSSVTSTNDTAVSATLTGLAAGTVYHFRVRATNGSGTGLGADQTFTTLSSNANLSDLVTDAVALTPSFSSSTIDYSAVVLNGTASLTITPTTAHPNATIKVNGVSVPSGSASGQINLNVGNNVITTVVTAENGSTTKTYTITVLRPSSNANLSALVLSAGTLTPAFSSATINYTVSVANTTSTLTVKPTVSNANARIKVKGVSVASGATSSTLQLAVGSNSIPVVVTAQDGTIKTYTVVVRRAGPQIALEQPASTNLTDGTSTVNFGGALINATNTLVFTIRNTGSVSLTGLNAVTINGTNASSFSFLSKPPASLAVGATTTFGVNFKPSTLGIKTAALHVPNNVAGAKNPFDINLVGQGVTPIEKWRLLWFNGIANSGDAADTASPRGDGVANLLKFATGMDPSKTGSMPGVVGKEGESFSFRYKRSKDAKSENVVFRVEWNDSLSTGTWSNEGVTETAVDQGETEDVKATIPSGGGQRFFRLKVTRNVVP